MTGDSGQLANMLDQVSTAAGSVNGDLERRAAAVTTADYAIAGGWETDLPDVLDALGLREQP